MPHFPGVFDRLVYRISTLPKLASVRSIIISDVSSMVLKVGTKVGTFIGCKSAWLFCIGRNLQKLRLAHWPDFFVLYDFAWTKGLTESKSSKRAYGNHQSTMIDIWRLKGFQRHRQRVSVTIDGFLGKMNTLSSDRLKQRKQQLECKASMTYRPPTCF